MHAALIALLGTILNADFSICNAANNQQWPSATYQNSQYYMFWQDERASPIYSLYGARMSTSGTIVDPQGKLLHADSAYSRASIAYDGTNFFVVFREGC